MPQVNANSGTLFVSGLSHRTPPIFGLDGHAGGTESRLEIDAAHGGLP